MKKTTLTFTSVLILSGCVGDRLEFTHKGSVDINKNGFICIKSSPGDLLTYYYLASSDNKYQSPLFFAENIAKKFPDTCLPVVVKKNVSYKMLYVLNDIKYRVTFGLDIKNTTETEGN